MVHVEKGKVTIHGDTATVMAEVHVLLYALLKDDATPIDLLQTAILDAFEEAYNDV